jgi:hypothetical protein
VVGNSESVQVQRGYLRQEARLLIAGLYVIALLAVGNVVQGSIPPPLSFAGLWFYTGFLPLVLARLIVPYFHRPADTLANGLALLVAVATLDPTSAAIPRDQVDLGRLLIAVYAAITLVASVLAMLGRDDTSPFFDWGPRATSFAGSIGRTEVGFSLYLGLLTIATFAEHPGSAALIGAAWVVFQFIRPFERLAERIYRRQPRATSATIVVDSLIDPNLVIGRARSDTQISIGDRVVWATGAKGRVVDRSLLLDSPRFYVALDGPAVVREGDRGRVEHQSDRVAVGYVAEETSIDELVLRGNPAHRSEVTEGRLLLAPVRGASTYFQLTRADLIERTDGPLRRHLLRGRARKLGTWNAEKHGFDQVPWLADAGASVELVKEERPPDTIGGIGRVPGTSYEIGVNLAPLVTHNTAILGILGVGKTSLAWELIQRLIVDDIRVIVFDITDEYATRFGAFFGDAEARWMYELIEKRIGGKRNNTAAPKETAGNVGEVKKAFTEVLQAFTASPSSVLVINPAALEVTMEDGAAWSGVVPLRRLSVPEVTRLLAEAILDFARTTWPADPAEKAKARLCVVLEEAHSLVPEGGSMSDRFEATAAARTARAILQGRKYGVGCILITQRTANVTKTILNQCHTIFAMRSFDATSEQFLGNYMGADYAALLPSLRERQAVAFGRGSTSEAPILIDLNDRGIFQAQWEDALSKVPPTVLNPGAAGVGAAPAAAAAAPAVPPATGVTATPPGPSPAPSPPSAGPAAPTGPSPSSSDDDLDDLPF